MNYFESIDISAAQPPSSFDGERLKAAGVSLVIVKSSEGVSYEDKHFAEHCAWVRAAGLQLWSYHFLRFRHGRPQDGDRQGEVAAELAARESCFRVCLDCEEGPPGVAYAEHNAATGAEVAESIRQAIAAIGDPIIYCGPGWWDTRPELATGDFASCDLWVAHYGVVKPWVPRPWSTAATPQPFGWQYQGPHGRVDGAPFPIDRSRFLVREVVTCPTSDTPFESTEI